MNDVLLKQGDKYIISEIEGLKMTYTRNDDPKCHTVVTLRDSMAYDELKRALEDICEHEGYESASGYLECENRFFTDEIARVYFDIREREEIEDYLEEAFDKVWLMRNCDVSTKTPRHETSRSVVGRIISSYNDIPENGYGTWDCGYWNGIMSALRWVLGTEKDFLDT